MNSDVSTIFTNLQPEQLDLVRPLFRKKAAPRGTVLFNQGDSATSLFILTSGEVEVKYKPDDGPELVVTRVRPESVVGWSAVIGNPNYTSSAVCSSACTMLYIQGEELRRLCEQYPDICPIILDRLAIMIAERLRNTHNHVIELLKQGLRIDLPDKPVLNKQFQES